MASYMAVIVQSLLLLAMMDLNSCNVIGQFEMDAAVADEHTDVTWTFNSSQPIFGFRVIIYDSAGVAVYESPLLDSTEDKISITHEFEGGTNQVCVLVQTNATEVITKCKDVSITNLKIVIGILAGVVFLIPCMAALMYIVYKDRKYIGINDEDIDDDRKPIIQNKGEGKAVTVTVVAEKVLGKGKVNEAFIEETNPVRKISQTEQKHAGAPSLNKNITNGKECLQQNIETSPETVEKDTVEVVVADIESNGSMNDSFPEANEGNENETPAKTDSEPNSGTRTETDAENSTTTKESDSAIEGQAKDVETETNVIAENSAESVDGIHLTNVEMDIQTTGQDFDESSDTSATVNNSTC